MHVYGIQGSELEEKKMGMEGCYIFLKVLHCL